MDFDKAKELLKDAIDEGGNLAEILEIFTDKVYQQGKQDGEAPEKADIHETGKTDTSGK